MSKLFKAIVGILTCTAVIWGNCLLYLANWRVVNDQNMILNLLLVQLATCAYITAVYTLYAKEDRLRASGENILVALIVLIPAVALVTVAYVLEGARSHIVMHVGQFLIELSCEIYLLTLWILVWYVFLQSYNQLYNLRTNKIWKYVAPIKALRRFFSGGYKPYEINPKLRQGSGNDFADISSELNQEEIQRLLLGASVLITGVPTRRASELACHILSERLDVGETANYVCSGEHAWSFWQVLSAKPPSQKGWQQNFVIVDAYSQGFGFTDEINEEYNARLELEGVTTIQTKTFAGVHTAIQDAFNVIKKRDRNSGTGYRRPMLMIYKHLSALCAFEGMEQLRVFWRHVIPAERNYQMVTIIIEDNSAGDEALGLLKQLVDFVFEYTIPDPSMPLTVKLVRSK